MGRAPFSLFRPDMGSFTPDPELFPRAAERFQWRWNRLLLAGMVGGWVAGFGVMILFGRGTGPVSLVVEWVGGAFGLVFLAAAGAALALPLASFIAARIGARGERVSVPLRRGALVAAVLVAVVGLLGLTLSSWGRWVGVALVAVAAGTALAALLSRTSSSGGWPGISASVLAGVVYAMAFVMVPYVNSGRERAFTSAVRVDLRHIQASQETYHDTHGTYSTDPTFAGALSSQDGVTVEELVVEVDGWRARATHAAGITCEVHGGPNADRSASGRAAIACDSTMPEPGEAMLSWLLAGALLMAGVMTGLGAWEVRRSGRGG